MEGDFIFTGIGNEVLVTVCCATLVSVIVGLVAFFKMFRSASQSPTVRISESTHQSYSNEICSICLGPYSLAVETNCSHKYCGSCLRSYLNNRAGGDFTIFNGHLTCPLCRQDINILLPCFTQEETQSAELENSRIAVESLVHDYNIRFGVGPRSLWSYVRDCPVLFRHMLFDFFSFGGVVCMFRVRVILCFLAALLYLGNPIDVIPEALFGIFGFLDDIIVFLIFVLYVSIIYRRFVINQALSQ